MLSQYLFLLTVTVIVNDVKALKADPIDWVNIEYVMASTSAGKQSTTSVAESAIIRGAASSAKNGPWSVTNSHGILPPSDNAHDYLSWAPYHWPNCNWCPTTGTNHIASDPNAGDTDSSDDSSTDDNDGNLGLLYPGYQGEDGIILVPSTADALTPRQIRFGPFPPPHRNDPSEGEVHLTLGLVPQAPIVMLSLLPGVAFPTLSAMLTSSTSSQTSDRIMASSTPVAVAAKKTTTKVTRTAKPTTSCTPSPTSSLAPSVTWTTCPYVQRDGQVNPDVRTLNGPGAIVSVSQSILYNALSYILQGTRSASQNVASFIDAFFLNSSTMVNPNLNFGQVVRGPGPSGQAGTFTGILDLRGMVKISNAIQLIKAAKSPDWTTARDEAMKAWTKKYVTWLKTSKIGLQTASKVNNHATFYVAQLSSLQILIGNTTDAASTLKGYFSNEFLDQIAASGEQPFEAARTRPFHYRCFNLEAMVANAKLGDQLGLNFWTARSRYGATIQTAVDFAMRVNPRNEDIAEILPHVASVAAAYGDPTGNYAAFMRKISNDYETKPFWYYDQTTAFPHSPANNATKRSVLWGKYVEDVTGAASLSPVTSAVAVVPFECPAVFNGTTEVEVDDGVFVSCSQVEPFYTTSLGLEYQ